MQQNQLRLKQQLEDYSKLADNTFFWGYLEFLRKDQAQYALRRCGTKSYTDEMIRYYQGEFAALELAGSEKEGGLLDRYLKQIKEDLDKK